METSRGASTSMCPPNGSPWLDISRAKWIVWGEKRKARTLGKRNKRRVLHRKALNHYNSAVCQASPVVFEMAQLEAVLREMDGKREGGPDEVGIAFLTRLPQLGRQRLLDLINR